MTFQVLPMNTMSRIHETSDLLMIRRMDSDLEASGRLSSVSRRGARLGRLLRATILPAAVAICMVSGPVQAQAQPTDGGS